MNRQEIKSILVLSVLIVALPLSVTTIAMVPLPISSPILTTPQNLETTKPFSFGPDVITFNNFSYVPELYDHYWALNTTTTGGSYISICEDGFATLYEEESSSGSNGLVRVFGFLDLEGWTGIGDLTLKLRIRLQTLNELPADLRFYVSIETWNYSLIWSNETIWDDSSDTDWIVLEIPILKADISHLWLPYTYKFSWGWYDNTDSNTYIKAQMDYLEVTGEKVPSEVLQMHRYVSTAPTVHSFEIHSGDDIDRAAVSYTTGVSCWDSLGYGSNELVALYPAICISLDPDINRVQMQRDGRTITQSSFNLIESVNVSVTVSHGSSNRVVYHFDKLVVGVNEVIGNDDIDRSPMINLATEALALNPSLGRFLTFDERYQREDVDHIDDERLVHSGTWFTFDLDHTRPRSMSDLLNLGSTDLKMDAFILMTLPWNDGIFRISLDYEVIFKHLVVETTFPQTEGSTTQNVVNVDLERSLYRFTDAFDYLKFIDIKHTHILDLDVPYDNELVSIQEVNSSAHISETINGDNWWLVERHYPPNVTLLLTAEESYFDEVIHSFDHYATDYWRSNYHWVHLDDWTTRDYAITLEDWRYSFHRVEVLYV